MKYLLFIGLVGLTLLNLFSCSEENAIAYAEYSPKIVVEGWIENGTTATVILSLSASFNHELDTAYLLQQVIRSAKVSVSNGEQTELLTLGVDNRYLPPYVYYGTSIKGEVGKSYTLKIEYNGKVLSAETYIPEPVALEDYWFVRDSLTEEVGHIHIKFRNTSDLFYQVATRVELKETVFTPCLYGNFSSDQFERNELVSIQINKGPILYPKVQFETYFAVWSTVHLKFRIQAKSGYDFWTSWQNEVLNAQNPIFPANTSLKSNIKGGIGIWCGYGTSNYKLEIKE